MVNKILLLLLIIFPTILYSVPTKEIKTRVVTVKSTNYYNDLTYFRSIDLDILGVDFKKKRIDLYISKEEERLLKLEGFSLIIKRTDIKGITIDPRYKTPEEVKTFIHAIHLDYPKLTLVKTIGTTHEGRDIFAIKISDNPTIHEIDEPAILFNSLHHAREVMTVEVAIDIIEYLLKNYTSNQDVKNWVDSNEIWVVPMLNVDGSNKVWTSYPMWRKNTGFNEHGVDLNRNYPFNWDKCNGSSGSRWSNTFRGPSPASELETNALMDLVAKIKPVFDISYHSYSELVIYPLGCNGERAINEEVIGKIGKDIGTIMDYEAGTAWEIIYSADGTDIDWMFGVHQVIPYVLELNSMREGFFPDYDEARDRTVIKNRKAWQHLLNRLDGPGVRGVVTHNNQTVENYTIKISRAEKELYSYNGNPDGTFHIVLNPGNYTLHFNGPEIEITKEIEIKDKRINLTIDL